MPLDHVRTVHHNCRSLHCPICDGGLYQCDVCGLIEGSLTSECPGVPSYVDYAYNVYIGDIDFVGGRWEKGATSPHCPAGLRLRCEALAQFPSP